MRKVNAPSSTTAAKLAEIAHCEEEANAAFEAANKDQAEYDKQLLTLSSGFLAVVLAFVKDIVPLKDVVCLACLYLALLALVLCILLVLISYQASSLINVRLREYWEGRKSNAEIQNRHTVVAFPEKLSKCVECLNRSSGIAFSLGILFLLIFFIVNINHEVHMEKQNQHAIEKQHQEAPSSIPEREERGSHIKTPSPPPTQDKKGK